MSENGQPSYNLLVTPTHEFVVRESTCVGVIDRNTGHWVVDHVSLGWSASLMPAADTSNGARWDVVVTGSHLEYRMGELLGLEKPSDAIVRNLAFATSTSKAA